MNASVCPGLPLRLLCTGSAYRIPLSPAVPVIQSCSMDGSTAIELRGVHISRAAAGSVLRGLDLAIGQGETVALVGRSGAGKSTILKLINGLLTPDAGQVIVDGRDTRDW